MFIHTHTHTQTKILKKPGTEKAKKGVTTVARLLRVRVFLSLVLLTGPVCVCMYVCALLPLAFCFALSHTFPSLPLSPSLLLLRLCCTFLWCPFRIHCGSTATTAARPTITIPVRGHAHTSSSITAQAARSLLDRPPTVSAAFAAATGRGPSHRVAAHPHARFAFDGIPKRRGEALGVAAGCSASKKSTFSCSFFFVRFVCRGVLVAVCVCARAPPVFCLWTRRFRILHSATRPSPAPFSCAVSYRPLARTRFVFPPPSLWPPLVCYVRV